MIEELEKRIIQNIQKIPPVPLSLFLSGGIDSSLVLALVRKTYPQTPISTYTLAKSKDYPDMIYAREVAKLFKTDHHEIVIADGDFRYFQNKYDKIKKYNFKGDINIYILCFYAKKFSNIVLTGDGGDECFGGYWLHEYPLGHKETGRIRSIEEIHPAPRKHIEEMVRMGFRNFLFKEKSDTEDYNAVWEYFIQCLAPKHLEPLLHTAELLDIQIFTPLFSESFLSFIRTLPYMERIGRKIEKQLALKYLPESVVQRESIGFDVALEPAGDSIGYL